MVSNEPATSETAAIDRLQKNSYAQDNLCAT
jgi:hypothetical protein